METSIFRLEHTDTDKMGVGLGPYVTHNCVTHNCVTHPYSKNRDLCAAHNNFSYPTPYEEGIRDMTQYDYCACTSIDGLSNWFGEWLEDIISEGFEVVEYVLHSNDIRLGDRQCIFDFRKVIKKKSVTYLVVSN